MRCRIGRAYDNDIVVNDPYVDAYQIELVYTAAAWVLRLMQSTNPVSINGQTIAAGEHRLRSGDRISVGRSQFIIFWENHPVAETKKQFSPWIDPERVGLVAPIAALLVVVGGDAVLRYATDSIDLEWRPYALGALFGTALLVCWAGVWAVVGRVLKHQHQFPSQLLVSSVIAGAISILFWFLPYLEFLANSATLGKIATYLAAFAALTVMLKYNLMIATHVERCTRAAMVVSGLIVVLTYAALEQRADRDYQTPKYSHVLKPPIPHLSRSETIESFMRGVESRTAKLD